MTKLLEEAIAKVRELSAEEQGMLAELLSSSSITGTYDASPEEAAGIERGMGEMRRGEIATDEDIAAIWKRHGL